ncbi:MAG: hypothetical protein J1E06_00630 [Acutalibacter sp.]|nr:hypothetical protein [Acutalibacter sp.]
MKKLTYENFIKARDFIFVNGDDVTCAWFHYNFVDGDSDAFIKVLEKHQYENGGFGGLLYEFEYQGPCLKCTEHAFRYMFYLKERPSADNPAIQKMVKYLLERYRPDFGCWGELLEPEVNDGMHVRWWTYPDCEIMPKANADERIRQYKPNGEAALAAIIALYPELVSKELYDEIIRYPVEHILRYYDERSPLFGKSARHDHGHNDIEVPYNLKCYQEFVKCLPDKTLADRLAEILRQNPTACMQLDYSTWENGYEELPCDVVETPDSIVYPVVKQVVDDSLDYLINRQSADGAWHLTWQFGEDERFRRLERLYETNYTMLVLARLGRFDRIEEVKFVG